MACRSHLFLGLTLNLLSPVIFPLAIVFNLYISPAIFLSRAFLVFLLIMIKATKRAKPELQVETKTTGFSSPATDYAERRLDIGDLIAPDPLPIFYFKVGKELVTELFSPGDILAIDRREEPVFGDICLGINSKKEFCIYRFGVNPVEHWGKITWIVRKVNG